MRQATLSAKGATRTIPIVMAMMPIRLGAVFVASLARPGGNITGFSTLATDLSGKRLELLKEIVPRLSHVAVFGTSTYPGNGQALKEMEVAAGAFGIKLQYLDVLMPTILRTHSERQAKHTLTQSSCWRVPSSFLSERGLPTS